ncbi:MAG: class I SAM-dependent methyltransferase [Methylobacteriaceae bacterium]|nr:class I SAM-dependent methyltransferase [Methylobacteriaceae bacterium]
MNIPTKVLSKDILDSIKRTRPVYAFGRRVRFALGSRLGARVVPGLGGRAHYNDFMLSSTDAEHVGGYRRGARQFVELLGRSLGEAGRDWSSIDACLEVGCGYGRIVRELRDRLDPSRIYVTDVIEEGARFTASEFGASAIPLIESSAETMPGKFDLVYLLSVYTHLRRDLVARNLAAVARAMKSGGVAVFTTHGQGSAETAERYEQYWLDKGAVLQGMSAEGYYYERYPYYYDEYGLTWFRRDAMQALVSEAAPELEFIAHHPMALDGHQDLFVFRKR